MKRLSRHVQHYLPLLGIFFAGVLGFSVFSYDRMFQSVVAFAVAVSYVVWGVVHHHIHKDLHASVIVEYVAIAVMGLIVVFTLLFRA